MTAFDLGDLKRRMDGALHVLDQELGGLRTGRASAGLLEPIVVEAYGSQMPLNQLATVNAPEPRLLTVQVWDKTMVKAVEMTIRDGNLGLNPISEGQLLRVPIPELTEERRKELAKVAHKYGEQSRIAVRNVRRDGMDSLKRQEHDGKISEDEHHELSAKVQKLTDDHIAKIGDVVDAKEKDILQV
ncbi:MAG: ribosome recycling factor [Alphaproteobacteria bacterium]|jgi:ribosome recycling factor|nr:ribosome recycling factor [Alphaproteobacteria bacterium]MDP6515704.1 ribosome recycling factor [Alphaproteobacteria bacterium]